MCATDTCQYSIVYFISINMIHVSIVWYVLLVLICEHKLDRSFLTHSTRFENIELLERTRRFDELGHTITTIFGISIFYQD